MSRASKTTLLLAAALLPLQSYAAASGNATGYPPCDILIEAGLGDSLLFATDPDYEPRIDTWWALNTRLRPWCLFMPADAAEVSAVMAALFEAGNGAGDWHIAVRSGGHSLGHTNNIDTGVTIDLGKLDGASYDGETNIASIGSGGRWKDVYAKLHEQGVVVTGGRDGGVGVGGFLLGGGLTFYMGRHGFGCDSIQNYEVVLANGTIVNANKNENADLWKALKGGGSNFGIVTRFDMEALPDTKLAYGQRLMSGNYSLDLVDVVAGFTDGYQEHDDDALVGLIMHNTSSNPADTMALAIHVNTQGVHNSTGFDKLRQIPALVPDETLSVTLADAAEGSQVPAGYWNAQATISFKNDKAILHYAIDLNNHLIQSLNAAIGASSYDAFAFFQPLPAYFRNLSASHGGNMLGLDQQQHNTIIWTGHVAVKTDAQDLAVAEARMAAMAAELKRFAAARDGDNALVFMNYASPAQDPLGSYGGESVGFIRGVAEKYDPVGVFQTRVPGGFKVSRVDV